MTREQRLAVRKLLSELEPEEVHHGDCLGADKEFHDEAKAFTKAWVVVHPGLVNTQRAFCLGDEARAAKPFLQRNHDIANAVDLLVATPGQQYEVLRSGTLSLIHISEPTRRTPISYAVFCLKK